MQQPKGFEVKCKERLVCKLDKALYGLKQAPGAWYIKIDEHLKGSGFQRSASDPNLYMKKKDGDLVILVVYVDDLVITGNSLKLIDEVNTDLGKAFEMTDLVLLHYCLGIEVWQNKDGIFISQTKYAKELLKTFRMEDCKPTDTPMETGLKLTKSEESKKVDETLY